MSVYLILVYDIIRPFGAAAQAGFGIGVRVMQSLFLPAIAIGFATAPVAGQNFGARLGPRVRQTFYSARRSARPSWSSLTHRVPARVRWHGRHLQQRSRGHRVRDGIPSHHQLELRRQRHRVRRRRACSRGWATRCRRSAAPSCVCLSSPCRDTSSRSSRGSTCAALVSLDGVRADSSDGGRVAAAPRVRSQAHLCGRRRRRRGAPARSVALRPEVVGQREAPGVLSCPHVRREDGRTRTWDPAMKTCNFSPDSSLAPWRWPAESRSRFRRAGLGDGGAQSTCVARGSLLSTAHGLQPRWSRDRRRRRAVRPQSLHGRRRRRVQVDRRRRPWAAGERRPDWRRHDRRDRTSPIPTRTSSTSAPGRRARAATSHSATASTSRRTPARRGTRRLPKGRAHWSPACSSAEPRLSYVAAVGDIFGPNKERGVYRTKDGGKTWEHPLPERPTGAVDPTMDVKDPECSLAAMWTRSGSRTR